MTAFVIAGFVVLAAAFFLIGKASDSSVPQMQTIAGNFRPQASWTKVDEKTLGTFLCTPGDLKCGSLQRRWNTDHRLTLSEFQGELKTAGWDFPVDGDCKPPGNASGLVVLCSARGVVDGYSVQVTITNHDPSEPDLFALRLEKISA